MIDAAADVIDVSSHVADGSGQLFLLGVVHLDDVAVDEHFPGVCAEVAGSELIHLVANYRQSENASVSGYCRAGVSPLSIRAETAQSDRLCRHDK